MNTDTKRAKMSPADRAKQFLPFSALKGYEEALRRKEEEIEALANRKNEPFADDSEVSRQDSDIP